MMSERSLFSPGRWIFGLDFPLWRAGPGPGRAVRTLLLPLLLAASSLGGCAHRPPVPSPPAPVTHVEMEPLQLVAQRRGEKLEIVHRDAAGLFREGGEAFEQAQYLRAVDRYQLLLAEFPDSSYAPVTRFNLGLALEQLDRHEEALTQYRHLIQQAPSSPDALDARFRSASCLNALRRHAEEAATLREILTITELGREDRLLAQIRLGDALLAAGQLDEAERVYLAVLSRPEPKGLPAPLLLPVSLQAQAQFGKARVEHERFLLQPIRLPQEQMDRDIHDKASSFLRAQAAYLKTIHLKVGEYVAAAGLKVGTLYEDFYRDLLAAPVPPELDAEETEIYFEELRKVIRPLVEQAIHVYERNLTYSERFGLGNDWVDQTRARLERLRRFLAGTSAVAPGGALLPEAVPGSPLFVGPPAPDPDLPPSAPDPVLPPAAAAPALPPAAAASALPPAAAAPALPPPGP
jgi:tetratricopeptide (TPR) repeat protein